MLDVNQNISPAAKKWDNEDYKMYNYYIGDFF